jgi:outer membrane protein OmpA-like peptidoglycan-associated protein
MDRYKSLEMELNKEKDARQKAEDLLMKLETELNKEKSELQKAEDLLVKITKERDDLLKEKSKPNAIIADLNERIKKLNAEIDKLKAEIDKLKGENDKLKGENDKPPILVVDAMQVSFEKGKAELERIHRETLQKDVFSELLNIVEKYKSVDTIEIIGHTDRSSVGGKSNLDHELLKALKGDENSLLTAGSNADLGLMRAIAVKQEWDKWLKKEGIILPRPIKVRCYSAAQGIAPASKNGKFFASQARRIEIRFTQLKEIKNAENLEIMKDGDSTVIEEMDKKEGN